MKYLFAVCLSVALGFGVSNFVVERQKQVASNDVQISVDEPQIRPLSPEPKVGTNKVERRAALLDIAVDTATGVNQSLLAADAGVARVVPQIYFASRPPDGRDAAVIIYQDVNNVKSPVVLVYFFENDQWDIFPEKFE